MTIVTMKIKIFNDFMDSIYQQLHYALNSIFGLTVTTCVSELARRPKTPTGIYQQYTSKLHQFS
jgi:hypothetical protein